jgi:hypothetical protein
MKPNGQKTSRVTMWTLSIAVHVAVILFVAFCKPVRDYLFSVVTEQELSVSEGRLQEILGDMLELNRSKGATLVGELNDRWEKVQAIRGRQVKRLEQARKVAVDVAPAAGLPAPDAKGVKTRTFSEVYDIARGIEERMVDDYKTIRALGMAAMRPELTVQEAMDATTVMRPARPKLPAKVFDLPILSTEQKRLDAFRDELKKAAKELQSIMAYCDKIVQFATDIDKSAEGDSMNLLMASADLGPDGYRGATLMPDELFDTHEYSLGSFHPMAGRKMAAKSEQAEWLYIDTWYVIGPFPNERRRALDTKFGPEAGVDLDAIYVGKDGREVKWDYLVSRSLKIEPADVATYAIYYAYTEIYSETERDVWLATGTDDHGKLWINNEHIWTSGTQPKPFKADEHVQQVHLKQGFNEILIRCENAGGTMGWCLLFCTSGAGG